MIFLGSNSAISIWVEVCERANIPVTGIIDSDYYGNTESICGIPVIDREENLGNYKKKLGTSSSKIWTNSFFLATNWDPSGINKEVTERNNEKRERLKALLEQFPDIPLKNIIDPLAVVPKDVELGGGNYIGAGAVIEPGAKIGKHTQIWYQCIVGHDVEIGEDCVLNRRATLWGANMGNHSYISLGSTYGGNYKDSYIGDNVFIHPGIAIAGRPIEDGETVTIREQLKNRRRTQVIGGYDTEAISK